MNTSKKIFNYILENFPNTIRTNTEDEGSLLGVPYPYMVACADDDGKFREMYYWGTYFTNVGLVEYGMAEQAKMNTDDILYLIDKHGFMPNANRSYFLNRSQPPFASLMVKLIFNHFKDKDWLAKAYKILEKEYSFWQNKRMTPTGLNFYGANDEFDAYRINTLFEDFQIRASKKFSATSDEKLKIAQTIATFVESGWDCSCRFEKDGYAYNPVCLNSLLFGYEKNMAEFAQILNNGEKKLWLQRADERKQKMEKYMLNPSNGLFMDWNFKENKFGPELTVASLYPLFVGLRENAENELKLLDNISLKNCWFINMDEYLDSDDKPIQYNNILSFHATMDKVLYSRINPELIMPKEQRLFPEPGNEAKIDNLIASLSSFLNNIDCLPEIYQKEIIEIANFFKL